MTFRGLRHHDPVRKTSGLAPDAQPCSRVKHDVGQHQQYDECQRPKHIEATAYPICLFFIHNDPIID